jgi:hypothetical protein
VNFVIETFCLLSIAGAKEGQGVMLLESHDFASHCSHCQCIIKKVSASDLYF